MKIFAAVAWLLGALSALAAADPALPVGIDLVARAGTEHISSRDVERRMGLAGAKLLALRERLQADGKWNAESENLFNAEYGPLFREQLRELIREALLLNEFKLRKLEYDRSEYDKEVRTRIAEARRRGWLNGPGALTESGIREDVKRELRLDTALGACLNIKLPTRREIEAYYQEHPADFPRPAGVKLRRIRILRIATNTLGREEVVEGAADKAEDLRKQATRVNFAELARQFSQEDQVDLAKAGGLLHGRDDDPFIARELLPAPLAHALLGLKPGELTPIYLCDEKSWAFALLEEERQAGTAPLEHALYQEIKRKLSREAVQQAEKTWLETQFKSGLVLDAAGKMLPLTALE